MSMGVTLEPDSELSGAAAIVGVGDTDYAFDYTVSRTREGPPQHDVGDRLAVTAFERALGDSGLRRGDIDGLGVAYGLGWANQANPDPGHVADVLGIRPNLVQKLSPINAGVIPSIVETLADARCDTFAFVYSAPMRSIRQIFGGDAQTRGPLTYYYFHPWGWSSQAAHWALMFTHYQAKYGVTEADLGAVAVDLREKARRNENAIMRAPLSIDDYLGSRYVVAPMHLLDMCLVNDGAVCLILRRRDMAQMLRHVPVLISGWGHGAVHEAKFDNMVVEGLYPQYQYAAGQALAMAGISVTDVDHFEGYDAATIHLALQVEGYGFVPRGEALSRWREGYMSVGGKLPTNTSGAMLSESYMQGWSHLVEAVRQLRHIYGSSPRQVADATISMTSLATTDEAFPMVLRRGDS
jgi:acetyl-CoA acetyltransferase